MLSTQFGDLLLPGSGAGLLEGEQAGSAVSDGEVVLLLERCLRLHSHSVLVRGYVLTSAMKLTTRMPGQTARLRCELICIVTL